MGNVIGGCPQLKKQNGKGLLKMFVVVVSPNKDGKIELTKEELQKMLDDAYNKGYTEGKLKSLDTITVPSYPVYYSNIRNVPERHVEITCDSELRD